MHNFFLMETQLQKNNSWPVFCRCREGQATSGHMARQYVQSWSRGRLPHHLLSTTHIHQLKVSSRSTCGDYYTTYFPQPAYISSRSVQGQLEVTLWRLPHHQLPTTYLHQFKVSSRSTRGHLVEITTPHTIHNPLPSAQGQFKVN